MNTKHLFSDLNSCVGVCMNCLIVVVWKVSHSPHEKKYGKSCFERACSMSNIQLFRFLFRSK